MKKLFSKRFYQHCPDCRQRMKRVGYTGTDLDSYVIDYECPCGACWHYSIRRNGMDRGWSKHNPNSQDDNHE